MQQRAAARFATSSWSRIITMASGAPRPGGGPGGEALQGLSSGEPEPLRRGEEDESRRRDMGVGPPEPLLPESQRHRAEDAEPGREERAPASVDISAEVMASRSTETGKNQQTDLPAAGEAGAAGRVRRPNYWHSDPSYRWRPDGVE